MPELLMLLSQSLPFPPPFFLRVKPAIFDLLLALCIAAYLGMMYLAIQVSHYVVAVACFSLGTAIEKYVEHRFNGRSKKENFSFYF